MKAGSSQQERIPEGTYMGRVVSVVDLGMQVKTNWKTGEEEGFKPELLITWELPSERITVTDEDGNETDKARWISKTYTASNNEKSNLYKLVNMLKPGAADVTDLINIPCMVSVGSTVTGNAKITSVIKAPSGMEVPPLETDESFFDFDAPQEELFLKQPAWVQDKIMGAENYSGFADAWGQS